MKRMSRMEGEKPTLMVIPMIDIIFFLLVFFMISTIYTIPQQSLSIMLPKTKTQQSAELRPVLIDFEKSGQLMIDDGYVTKEQLISSVKAKIGENKNQNFLIRADKDLSYGKVVELMDDMKVAGAASISIATVNKIGDAMPKKYVDVWKYPHMTYKKAFVIATIISIITVGVAFISFSDYIESQMIGSLQINFLTEQEAEKQVEEIKEQIKEEKVHELQYQKELENNKVQPDNGGAGHGGQNGNSAVPTKSDVSPSSQQARAGETGTIKQSSVGSNTGSGLVGPEGPGIGYASTGSGEGLSDREGTGGTEADVGGGGVFSYDGYWSNLQSAINSNYPTDVYTMGIQGDVTLRIYFAPGGSVASVEVLNSDDPILSEHAMEYAHSVGGAENSTGTQQYADITIHYNL